MNIKSDTESSFTFKRGDIKTANNSDNINNNQNGGGLFCSDEFNNILLECLSDERPDIACYLLCKLDKMPTDITKCDESGRNILHYMTIYATTGNMVIHLGKLLRDSCQYKLKTAINSQDKNGNTPTHYATILGFNSLVKLYIEKGADLTFVNKSGEKVIEDDSSDNNLTVNPTVNPTVIIVKQQTKINPEHDTFTFRRDMIDISDDSDTPVPKDVPKDVSKLNQPILSDQTEHFFREIENAFNKKSADKTEERIIRSQSGGLSDKKNINSELTIATDKIIDGILNRTKINTLLHKDSELSISTNDILDKIINKTNEVSVNNIKNTIEQKGGKKSSKKSKSKSKSKSKKDKHISRIHGERTISTFSEITSKISDNQKYVDPVNSDGSDISDIAHQIARQSSDIHERTVMKIIEILKLNKDKPEDMQKARNYKAAIYRIVKEKNPLLNNFDRAVEMEKSITKEMLNSIDINKVTNEIEKHLSEKITDNTNSSKKTDSVTTMDTTEKTKKTEKTEKSKKSKQSRANTQSNIQTDTDSITFSSKSNSSSDISTIS